MNTAEWIWAYDTDEPEWITVRGTHVPMNEEGNLSGHVGSKIEKAAEKKEDVFGEAFVAYTGNPAEAIEHLLREKRGHVPGAFHKEGLGDIDLPYGKTGKGGFGLAHIIERRGEKGDDGVAFVRSLPNLVAKGTVERRKEFPGRAYIVHPSGETAVRLDWDGKRRNWIVTAYPYTKDTAPKPRLDVEPSDRASGDEQRLPPPHFGALDSQYPSSRGKTMTNHHATHMAIDRASVRKTDENGYLHVATSHITKATVNPYYGHEIPGAEDKGLDPDKIYYGLRDPDELQKSLPTWAGLPLHIEHHIDSADAPQKLTRVGTVGTEITWNAPYVDAPLTVWDRQAIDGIEDGSFRELSCAYRYDPDFTAGEFDGKKYDFVMRNIRGNHVALVEEGRAGPDVLVADAAITANKQKKLEKIMKKLQSFFRGAKDNDPATEQKEVDLAQAIIDLHKVDPLSGEIKDVAEDETGVAELKYLVEGLKDKLPPEDLKKLTDAIVAMAKRNVSTDMPPAAAPESTDNGLKDAMDKCGVDAENEAESRAFAEGVKYGEKLEKNPAEREKLDREHESEGMKKSMEEKEAMDKALAKKFLGAADADKIRAQATADAMRSFREISEAVKAVRPLIGEMDPFAFDSANKVYAMALDQLGIDSKKYDEKAWRGMVDMLSAERSGQTQRFAHDSKPIPADGPFANLKKIVVSR